MIRTADTADANAICNIYNYYVEHTVITFEEEPVSVDEMQTRIKTVTAEYPWLVFEKENRIMGYAYAARWKDRSAYRYSAESAVYLSKDVLGKGIGTELYTALISAIRGYDIHTLLGGIALPNPASIALHEKLGFEKTALLREVGRKFNQWIDVGYWELIIVN